MTTAFHRLLNRLMGATLAICLGLSLMLTACGNTSKSQSILTGNYTEDTIAVAKSLKETIALPKDSEELETKEDDAVNLITDYMSIYRNRPQVNELDSFTTMQTALNSLAGHYKTFSNRPVPESLKERLNKELEKAQIEVNRDS